MNLVSLNTGTGDTRVRDYQCYVPVFNDANWIQTSNPRTAGTTDFCEYYNNHARRCQQCWRLVPQLTHDCATSANGVCRIATETRWIRWPAHALVCAVMQPWRETHRREHELKG
jgi:hypothetical protein